MTMKWGPDEFAKTIAGLKHKKPSLVRLRFPNYRNIRPNELLEFTFPVTVLFGRNGTNKSSVLQAIYGASKGNSIGDYWFETALDAIPTVNSTGAKQSVVHTYLDSTGQEVECLKARAPRGKKDPDYWEAAKPTQVYGFKPGAQRMPPLGNSIVYLDFRQILPVFDKYLYFPDPQHLERLGLYAKLKGTLRRAYRPQDYLRRRTPRVKKLLQECGQSFSEETLSLASHILGRKYESGSYLEHDVYRGHTGTTMVLRTATFTEGYSDAYAGSGESAALTLIKAVQKAAPGSVILLDEPETSLHPSAQQFVLEFLAHMALHNDLQFVIATHSSYFGESLPIEAIRLLREGHSGKVEIVSGLTAKEALHDVAMLPRERTLLVEDERAKTIVLGAFDKDPGNLEREYSVRVRRGGASVILRDIAAHGSANARHLLVVLDGDQRPSTPIPEHDKLPRGLSALSKLIAQLTKGNDKNGPKITFATEEDCIEYITFLRNNVFYLPGTTPEDAIWIRENVKSVMSGLVDEHVLDNIELEPDHKARLRTLADAVPGFTEDTVFELLLAKRLQATPEFVADLLNWVRKHVNKSA